MLAGLHQVQGVPQPPPDGNIQDRHGDAGAAVAVQQTVNEERAGIEAQ